MNTEQQPVVAAPELFVIDDFLIPRGDHLAMQKRILALGITEERARAEIFVTRANKKARRISEAASRLLELTEDYCDEGPSREGWCSKTLEDARTELRAALEGGTT